jgi:hypothetical protein
MRFSHTFSGFCKSRVDEGCETRSVGMGGDNSPTLPSAVRSVNLSCRHEFARMTAERYIRQEMLLPSRIFHCRSQLSCSALRSWSDQRPCHRIPLRASSTAARPTDSLTPPHLHLYLEHSHEPSEVCLFGRMLMTACLL